MGIAWTLTRAEYPRTDRAFENSYTYKVFAFQCVNFYGALFYLAIVRGRGTVPPHQQSFQSPCPVSGCVVDVTIQLAIIMIGKQAINNIMELGIPLLKAFVKRIRRRRQQKKGQNGDAKAPMPCWQRDFYLGEQSRILLFDDYLELLIQYGFTTMFVAAFPLAPLFAFLNNLIEIRLDAYKMTVLNQRCVPLRAKNLGPWDKLLGVVTRMTVIMNALVIAFTTKFVDRLVYLLLDGNDWVSKNYVPTPKANFLFYTLSVHNTSQPKNTSSVLTDLAGTNEMARNLTVGKGGSVGTMTDNTCYYVDYREHFSDAEDPYAPSIVWWHVLAAKLIFIILFEHFIMLFQTILAYFIPDVPKREKMRMARERYLSQVGFMKREFGGKDRRVTGVWDEEEDEAKAFVPDELPEWLKPESPTASNVTSGTQRAIRRAPKSPADVEDGIKARRGKVIARNQNVKRRPFLMMLFRKLMLCD